MKKRFLLLNTAILLIFIVSGFAYHNYSRLKDVAVGSLALKQLEEREDISLEKISSLQLSVYSIQANELSQVRKDIMAKFQESDFESITIQPRAAFIDSLLFDSKFKQYMNNSNLTKSNKSLLNKMKLYLPNELLISFLANSQSINQIFSIEEYLTENGYSYIGGSSIPSVKSQVKHYYYDKNLFNDLVTEFAAIAQERDFLLKQRGNNKIIGIALMGFLFIFMTTLIQLYDFYLLNINSEKIKFLLKGHINPRKYQRYIAKMKSISLILIIIVCILDFALKLSSKININLDQKLLIFISFTALTNLLIFTIKKERIDI